MRKTIILGNGFDINLGLPTKYEHFIDSSIFKSRVSAFTQPTRYGNDHPVNLFKYINSKASLDNRWTDIELLLSDYAKKGELLLSTRDGQRRVSNVSTQDIVDYFEELKDSLRQYISSIPFREKVNYSSMAFQLLKAISSYKGYELSVISFNYTIPEEIFPELNLRGRIDNIHGNIKSDIILGFNESSAYDSSYDYMVKAKSSINQIQRVKNTIRESDELLIFGHSLGETDSDYFNGILTYNWYNKRIIIVTYDDRAKQSIIERLHAIGPRDIAGHVEWVMTSQDKNNIILL